MTNVLFFKGTYKVMMTVSLDQHFHQDLKNNRVHQKSKQINTVIYCSELLQVTVIVWDYPVWINDEIQKLKVHSFPSGHLCWDQPCLLGFAEQHTVMMMIMMVKMERVSQGLPYLRTTRLRPPAVRERMRMWLDPCRPKGLFKTLWLWTLSVEHRGWKRS